MGAARSLCAKWPALRNPCNCDPQFPTNVVGTPSFYLHLHAGVGLMITFRNVSLIYPNSERTIVEDASFDVHEGEFVLLMGLTGAGKSSVLKLINGLVPHHTGGILSGEISVAGRSTRALKPEQQRVAIASALVTNPKVLLLDEPTSALDPIAAEEVLSILHRLVHDLGLTIIVAEHRLERVIQFVDRIILVHGDGTLELGSADEVLKDSPIAPPLVELARILKLPAIPLSIREFRKIAPTIQAALNVSTEQLQKVGEPVLQVKNLSASYEDSHSMYALSDINLDLHAGEVVALMGRNGAGKTTLLKCAVGQAPIISGSIEVLGRDPQSFSDQELIACVGYVPQEPSDLLYGQSVEEECALADRDNKVESGSTLRIYSELMNIPSLSAHPRDISEGQRLGLALSIILSAQPEVIADGTTRQVLTASPAFAPQVSKALPQSTWLTVAEVESYVNAQK